MGRYLRRLSLIADSFWIGCALQREYTMGQPLQCLLQNDLQKCPVEKTTWNRNALKRCQPASGGRGRPIVDDGSIAPRLPPCLARWTSGVGSTNRWCQALVRSTH